MPLTVCVLLILEFYRCLTVDLDCDVTTVADHFEREPLIRLDQSFMHRDDSVEAARKLLVAATRVDLGLIAQRIATAKVQAVFTAEEYAAVPLGVDPGLDPDVKTLEVASLTEQVADLVSVAHEDAV